MPANISSHELSKHSTLDDLWMAIDGQVYDLTEFAPSHPGGQQVLLQCGGRDATTEYHRVHAPSLIKTSLTISKYMGRLDDTAASEPPATPAAQQTIPTQPTNSQIPPLSSLISTQDFAAAAALSFPPKTYAFVSSAATDLVTHRANSATYAKIGLRPRVLRDVSSVSIATTILGHPVSSPIFVAPTSLGKLIHPEGEKEIGRACKELGIAQVVSTSASFSLGEILDAIKDHPVPDHQSQKNHHPVFFQLYVDRDRAKSESLLSTAFSPQSHSSSPTLSTLFLTVDCPVPGKREADERTSLPLTPSSLPPTNPMTGATAVPDAKGGGLGRITGRFLDASLTWAETITWLRRHLPANTKIVLKGIQTWQDARRALRAGVDGIVVSNHGGRSVDGAPAVVLVLLEIRKNCPEVLDREGGLEVLVDGGVMRGTDVFKALALGARAVGVGRGVLWGLGLYGAEGVKRVVEVLNDELETTMRLCGVVSVDDGLRGRRGLVNTRAVDWLVPGRGEGDGGDDEEDEGQGGEGGDMDDKGRKNWKGRRGGGGSKL